MPFSFTPSEITKLKHCLHPAAHTILAASPAKLYIAHPNPHQWTFTGLSGHILLTKTKDVIYFFHMVDLSGDTAEVLWAFELWRGFVYVMDTPWFHSFEMDGYMGGLSFFDEGDAERFYRKVISQMGQVETPTLALVQRQLELSRHALPSNWTRRAPPSSEPHELKHVSMVMSNVHGYIATFDTTEGKAGVTEKILDQLDRRGIQTDVVKPREISGPSSDVEVHWKKALMDMGKKMARSVHHYVGRMSRSGVQGGSSGQETGSNSRHPPALPPRPRRGDNPPLSSDVEPPHPSSIPCAPLRAPPSPPETTFESQEPQQEVDQVPTHTSLVTPPSSNALSPLRQPTRAPPAIPQPPPLPARISPPYPTFHNRNALLASIRQSGGVGGLRRVKPNFSKTYFRFLSQRLRRQRGIMLENERADQ